MTARLLFAVAVAGLAVDTAAAQSPGVPPAPFPPAPVMSVAAAQMSETGRTRRIGRRTRVVTPTPTMVAPAAVTPVMMPVGPVVMPPVGSTAAVTEGVVQMSASEPVPTAPPMAMPGDPKATPAVAGGAATTVTMTPPGVVSAPAMPMPAMTADEAPMASTERSRTVRRGLFGRLRR